MPTASGSAAFSGGTVNFHDARFSGGSVDGTVYFDHAEFSGTEVDLSDAQIAVNGAGPRNLPPGPVPGLKVPSDWGTHAHTAGPE